VREVQRPELVDGRQFCCLCCGGDDFFVRRASLSSRLMELAGFAFAGPRAAVLLCRRCGHVAWFLGPNATKLLKGRVAHSSEGS
jgi:hypothetical protein